MNRSPGGARETLPPMALPMAVAQVQVAAPPVDPVTRTLGRLPLAVVARLGEAPWAPPVAVLLGALLAL
ncbi:MAG: hypothetical protein FJ090_21955, partial [Deltaproteobacteria bacterium]|nr:hypothetical protein [Deltaproteobacteria bacterium]